MNKVVLIIDDDVTISDILTEVLINESFTIKIISKTDDIPEAINEHKPSLVIINYLLRGKNGGEICNEIKLHKRMAKTPVILASAYPRVLQSVGKYNYDEIIEKPYVVSNLIERINYYLA